MNLSGVVRVSEATRNEPPLDDLTLCEVEAAAADLLGVCSQQGYEDAVAVLVEGAPRLVAEVRRLRQQITAVREALEVAAPWVNTYPVTSERQYDDKCAAIRQIAEAFALAAFARAIAKTARRGIPDPDPEAK